MTIWYACDFLRGCYIQNVCLSGSGWDLIDQEQIIALCCFKAGSLLTRVLALSHILLWGKVWQHHVCVSLKPFLSFPSPSLPLLTYCLGYWRNPWLSSKLGKASGVIILLGDALLICQCPNKAQPYGI